MTTPLGLRRLKMTCGLAAALALLVVIWREYQHGLRDSRFLTGWLLFAILVGLAAFHLRKKLPGLPLGTAAAWLQLHAYAGLFSLALCGLHVGLAWPDGWFERALLCLYLFVALTGIGGLLISRWIPRRLSRRGEDVIYERIPLFRKRLEGRLATQLAALPADQQTACEELLDGRQRFWSQLLSSTGHLRRRQAALTAFAAPLSEEDRSTVDKLRQTVTRQDDLAFHHANQWLLKAWLFVHIPATWALLIAALLHAALVHAFGGFA